MKLLVGTILLTVSLSSFASIFGSHEGVEMASGEDCRVHIVKSGKKVSIAVISGDQGVAVNNIKASKLLKSIKENDLYNYTDVDKSFRTTETTSLDVSTFDSKTLNFVTVIKSKVKRGCIFGCEEKRTQIICSIRD